MVSYQTNFGEQYACPGNFYVGMKTMVITLYKFDLGVRGISFDIIAHSIYREKQS